MDIETSRFGTQAVRFQSLAPPSPALSRALALLAGQLAMREGVLDVAIGYTEVVASTATPAQAQQLQDLSWSLPQVDAAQGFGEHRIPVRYDGEDLQWLAGQLGMGEQAIIDAHCSSRYTVAMIGFKPHFPYLHGLDPVLATVPRRDAPRQRVRAGAVAIAAGQAGIYPCDTAGGWHVLGYCDPRLCEPLRAGDTVIFERCEA